MRFSTLVSFFLVAFIVMTAIASRSLITVKAATPQGVISIAFDDNYQNQYDTAFPIMDEYGVTGTFYVRTDNIGKTGYMTSGQLQILQIDGNEIASHSHTHPILTSMTEAQIRYECEHSKTILQSYGLTISDFAYPEGLTNSTVDSIVSQYYRSGRTAYVEPYLMEVPTSQFRVAGFSAETADSTALSLLKDMVDEVQTTDSWAIIFFHNIVPGVNTQEYTTSAEDFEGFLNYTVSKGVQTMTVSQVLDSTLLSTAANFGTVSPSSGLYSLGETLTIEASPPSVGAGERYVWLGWTGSGEGSYSGSNNPASITLNGQIQQTASWRHEFRLSLSGENGNTTPSAGEYWYQAGSNVDLEALSQVAGSGERYEWDRWTGTGAGSYSGSDMHVSIVMNAPITEAASWIHQYFVNVSSIFGVVEGAGWYNSGATAYATVNNQFINESSEIRSLFTGWSGGGTGSGLTSDPITVNSPLSVMAMWKKQYLVVFDQTGLPSSPNPGVLVNSTNHDLPFSIWIDDGDRVEFVFPDQFQGSVLTFPVNQSSLIVTSPVRMTAQYAVRIDFGLLALIIVPLVSVFLLAAVMLLRRRKATS